MERFARMAPHIGDVAIEDVRRPRGFFDLLERRFNGALHHGSLTPLHRVCSLARGHKVQTVVIEEIGPAQELKEENDDLAQLGRWQRAHRVLRMSFFKTVIISPEEIAKQPNESFIGYAIWKEDFGASPIAECSRVYEAILPPPPEPYIHVRGIPQKPCRVAGRTFTAKGFPFYQQNATTNVCAHAAVRTLSSCSPANELTFREMNEILKLRGTDFKKRKGLFADEIEKLVKHIGVECVRANYNPHVPDADAEQPDVQYQRYVYGSIESGSPAIIIFGENGGGESQAANSEFLHAVTVFGHTFNRHMWVPRVEVARFRLGETTGYIPSDLWAGSFVGHDDTLGPHFNVPRHYMRSMRSATHDHPQYPDVTEGVAHVICAQRRFAKMHPIDAELTAIGWLSSISSDHEAKLAPEWGRRLLCQRDNSQLILRPILVSKDEYLGEMKVLRGWNRENERVSETLLSQISDMLALEQFWMVEVSVQELFPTNWRKLGEILIDPKFSKDDLTVENFQSAVIAARLPGLWIGPDRIPISIPITTHTCLFGCSEGE